MVSGTLVVNGKAGEITGSGMRGGTLCIEGDVKTFDPRAFENNHGTIIWKGITLWKQDHFTPEGIAMKNAGQIPGVSPE